MASGTGASFIRGGSSLILYIDRIAHIPQDVLHAHWERDLYTHHA
jgi:hypothetical protein